MRALLARTLSACLLLLAPVATASAGGLIDEVRVGGLAQNIEPTGHRNEHGANINAEVLFAPVSAPTGDQVQNVLWGFRPHVGATYNFEGTTNKLYAGLTWGAPLTAGFFLEGSLGLAVHDGGLAEDNRTQYGCRVNFRESASLGYALDPNWRVMLMVDHMSNADLCPQNRGLTNAGLRLGYRLD
jgi:lipid A 3-O-deacylase